MRARLGLVAAFLLLTLPAFLALPAQAQLPTLPGGGGGPGTTSVSVTMQLQDPAAALVPTRPYSLTLTINYQYGPGAALPPDQPGQGDPSGVVCGEVAVTDPPPWANVSVIPPTICFRLGPTFVASGTTVSNSSGIIEVNVTEGAPALEPYGLNVTFASPPTGTLAAGQGSVSRVIMPAYQGKLQVTTPPSLTLRGGAPQQLPLTVRNVGNGPNQVVFTNWTAPQGMRLDLPGPFVLDRGEERTVHATVRSPWTTPVRGQVMVEATSGHPTQRDLQGDSPRTRLDVQANAAVPGPEAGALVLAGLATAALARRR